MSILIKKFKDDILKYPVYQHQMFEIICKNMNEILPNNKEYTFEEYLENRIKNSGEETKTTTLIAFDEKNVCGYFQYFYKESEDVIYWSEIEIESNHMNDHFTFPLLIKSAIFDEEYIKTEKFQLYVNDKNQKSKSVVNFMGFSPIKEVGRGKRYECERGNLVKWYTNKYKCK
jgi:hypothetical protein